MRDDLDSRITMVGVCRKVGSRRGRKKFGEQSEWTSAKLRSETVRVRPK